MILVFEEKSIREKFEKELKRACIYRRLDSEIFGDGVSSEDYLNRMFMGTSIPFYKEVYRKQVAQNAIDNEIVILDCDPSIPDEVNKCPVIYITDRTEGNDEEFGQLPVKYTGSVSGTLQAARVMLTYWVNKYGEGRSERDFYQDFFKASVNRVPKQLRIIAAERIHGEFVAGVNVEFKDDTIPSISALISDTEKAGYRVFVDDRTNAGFFNIEDFYCTVVWAESEEAFLDVCNSLEERNENLIRDNKAIRTVVDENVEGWKMDIYHTIFLEHEKESSEKNYKKIPSGYIQIYYNSAYYELQLERLGVEVEVDDVVFLNKVLEYIKEKLIEFGGTVRVGMNFYGNEKLENLLPKEK